MKWIKPEFKKRKYLNFFRDWHVGKFEACCYSYIVFPNRSSFPANPPCDVVEWSAGIFQFYVWEPKNTIFGRGLEWGWLPSLKLTGWHLNMDGLNTSFLLEWPVFRCELLVLGMTRSFLLVGVWFWWFRWWCSLILWCAYTLHIPWFWYHPIIRATSPFELKWMFFCLVF